METEDTVDEYMMMISVQHVREALSSRTDKETRRLLDGERPLVRAPLLKFILASLQLEKASRKSLRRLFKETGKIEFVEMAKYPNIDVMKYGDADATEVLTLRSSTGGVRQQNCCNSYLTFHIL